MWAIVVAAGGGSRFGGAKHDHELDGRPLWQWGRDALLEGGAASVVVVGPVEGGVPGGRRRQDSVANGLAVVPTEVEYVAIHDAARPLASALLVEDMHRLLIASDMDGVVPVVPLQDTVKEVAESRVVRRTLDRTQLVAVQTPQMFRADVLRAAHGAYVGDATDDAAMVEAMGGSVMTMAGERTALKITYPEDMVMARHYLNRKRHS